MTTSAIAAVLVAIVMIEANLEINIAVREVPVQIIEKEIGIDLGPDREIIDIMGQEHTQGIVDISVYTTKSQKGNSNKNKRFKLMVIL